MANQNNKTVIITGANSGIGRETALGLAKQNFNVILACRNLQKAEETRDYIIRNSKNDSVNAEQLDLGNLNNIKTFAKKIQINYKRINVLINNAGSVYNYLGFTEDGIEQTFGVNHIGHFYLTRLLLNKIIKSKPSRIINIASFAHYSSEGIQINDINYENTQYKGFKAYSESKLANVYFTRHLATLLDPKVTTVNAVHPGMVRSGFGMDGDLKGLYGQMNKIFRFFEISSTAGARTPIWLASGEKGGRVTGEYFARKRPGLISTNARSPEDAKVIWDYSENLIKERGFSLPSIN